MDTSSWSAATGSSPGFPSFECHRTKATSFQVLSALPSVENDVVVKILTEQL